MLNCRDVKDIENTLANGIVRHDTLDKIEKLYKDLVDISVERMTIAPLTKVFLKALSHYQIEQNKALAQMRINELKIPICKL